MALVLYSWTFHLSVMTHRDTVGRLAESALQESACSCDWWMAWSPTVTKCQSSWLASVFDHSWSTTSRVAYHRTHSRSISFQIRSKKVNQYAYIASEIQCRISLSWYFRGVSLSTPHYTPKTKIPFVTEKVWFENKLNFWRLVVDVIDRKSFRPECQTVISHDNTDVKDHYKLQLIIVVTQWNWPDSVKMRTNSINQFIKYFVAWKWERNCEKILNGDLRVGPQISPIK